MFQRPVHDDTLGSGMADDAGDLTVSSAAPDRVLHSDPHDFAGLYIRHRASFTLHARRYLRDARDADEVVQEAFLRLFLALPELDTELQALAYCRRTITNLCIDRYRAQARRPQLVAIEHVPDADLAEDEFADPVIQAEDAALVRAALSMLSPLHRAALVKREIEEKPLPVIAEELDIPEESVKHVLFRARRSLRKLLAGTSVAPGVGEISEVLARAARKGSTGLAGLVALLVLAGLGTGPDLRAVPVFGQDLPDLPSIVEIAGGVASGVAGVAGGIVSAVTGSSSGGEGDGSSADSGGGDTGPLLIAPSTSPSPDSGNATATVTLVEPPLLSPIIGIATPVAVPSMTPTTLPTPTRPGASSPTAAATSVATPAADKPRRRTTSEPSSATSTSSSPSASASAQPTADRYTGSPSPSATAEPGKSQQKDDPSAWKTEGVTWAVDPETGGLVQVSLDEIGADGTYRRP